MVDTLNREDILESLSVQGYVRLPLIYKEVEIMQASRHFLNFLTLSQSVKDSFIKLADPRDRGSHVGYAQKKRSFGDSDNKEFFNYRGLTEILLNSVIEHNEQDLRVVDFLDSARTLYSSTKKTLAEVLKTIDFRIYEKIFLVNPDRFITLRFVKYDQTEKEEFVATPHYDRGSCTLAVAESGAGLRIGRSVHTLTEVVKEPGTCLFFPSYTFARDTGLEGIVPAWHDVVDKGEECPYPGVARWSIVLFADVEGGDISYEDTHTVKFD